MSGTRQSLAGRSFHMMGIGGAGVSALAQLAHAWGAQVSGCDQASSVYMDLVRGCGIEVQLGHDASHVDDDVELVVSSAIGVDHPERSAGESRARRVWLRGELLGELTRLRRSVVVAGAHGKSTTTAMLTHAAVGCGLDVSSVLGATMSDGRNVRLGRSDWLISEGDESDRTLLHLDAEIAVITNIERDHHHTFATDEDVFQVYLTWVNSLPQSSVLIAGPGPVLDRLEQEASPRTVVRFGEDPAEIRAMQLQLRVPGVHNALNAFAARTACVRMGLDREAATTALASFTGIGRRYELHGTVRGIDVVDDYGHHPTEVAATIGAAKEARDQRGAGGRVIVVFQPHLYSRTRALYREFAQALKLADSVWLLPIYGARERPEPGVTSAMIVDSLEPADAARVTALDSFDPATGDPATMLAEVMTGDVIITMGAGDITKLAPRLVAALEQRS